MNRFRCLSIIAITVLSLTMVGQERTIQQNALPPAVQKTVAEQSRGATIKGYATEVEHGKRVYEVEMIVNGHSKDIQIGSDGTLNEVEEQFAFDSLPKEVQTALITRAAGAKITKVESLTKSGRRVAYEEATIKGTKKGEIQVGPDGAKLSHAE